MKKNNIITLLIFVLSIPVFAEKISFSADSMSGIASDKKSYTKLSGNAKVITDSMEISADTIEISGDNFRIITAKGNIQGKNKHSRMDFTCEEMKYDRDTEKATLKTHVHLVDTENNLTADAELIEYNQKSEIAVLQINVSMRQDKNLCTAAYAIYRKNQQMLFMNGNPQIQQDSDIFRAQEIELNIETQEIKLDGRVRGSVTSSN